MAVIQDYLCNIAGSERMFQYICEEFPEADAYTLAYNPNATLDYFAGRNIKVTWMNKFVQSANTFKWLFPISTYVMGSVDLRQYDLVLSSSATVAKYVNVVTATFQLGQYGNLKNILGIVLNQNY
jgi:hypothetical protein